VNLADYGQITSVVVSRDGEVVVEEYAEGDAETLRNTRSCTKTVAGMLLGIAIDRGIVAGVDMRLEELLGEPAPPVTLRELLTMSSCLDCNDWDDSSPGNEELMYPQDDWLGFALGLPLRSSKGSATAPPASSRSGSGSSACSASRSPSLRGARCSPARGRARGMGSHAARGDVDRRRPSS
jgi:CubicO group peptidase (beta-lactamase class C family)